MANYAKLAPLAVFMLATFLTFPMKNVEAVDCSGACSPFETTPCRSTDCRCVPWGLVAGQCIYPTGSERIVKMVEEHPYLCESHSDCVKKGNGDFCANYPNSEIPYGWCFSSNTEAQQFFTIGSKLAGKDLFNIGSNCKTKDFLKMAAAIST